MPLKVKLFIKKSGPCLTISGLPAVLVLIVFDTVSAVLAENGIKVAAPPAGVRK